MDNTFFHRPFHNFLSRVGTFLGVNIPTCVVWMAKQRSSNEQSDLKEAIAKADGKIIHLNKIFLSLIKVIGILSRICRKRG